MSTKYTPFARIIGQSSVKSKLSFFLDGFRKNNIFPNCIFLAGRGSGKTTLAKEVCRELFLIKKKSNISRPMIEVNCASITSTDQFMNAVLLPMVGKEASFVMDECSSLHRKVVTLMLTMLNPNKENQNKITYNNEEIVIDFKKWTFLFCTTAPQLVHQDLRDRLEEISLEAYSYNDLASIIKMSLLNYSISDEVCLEIAPFCRGNARSATKVSEKISTYLEVNNRKEFEQKDIAPLMKLLDTFPLGLNRQEIQLLQFMSTQPDMSLNALAARSGLEKSAIQNFERYISKQNLMIVRNKRMITADGHRYLNSIKNLV